MVDNKTRFCYWSKVSVHLGWIHTKRLRNQMRNFSLLVARLQKQSPIWQLSTKPEGFPVSRNIRYYLYVDKFEHVRRVGGCTLRSKVNKFEHVLGMGPIREQGPVQRSETGALYGEVQCIMGKCNNGPPWTDKTRNITFSQLRWRAVINALVIAVLNIILHYIKFILNLY